jgi:hypothetical protein
MDQNKLEKLVVVLFLWDRYCVQNSLPLICVLRHINLVHNVTLYFPKIHFNTIFSSTFI